MSDIQETLSPLEQRVHDYVRQGTKLTLTRGGVMSLLGLGRMARLEAGEIPLGLRMSFDELDADAACAWVDQHECREALKEMYGAVAKKDDEDE